MAKKKRPKTFEAQTAVRCSLEQLASWQSAADVAERDLADWIRRTLDAAVKIQVKGLAKGDRKGADR